MLADWSDLKAVFGGAAALAAAVFAVAMAFDPVWALRYLGCAALATANFFALAVLLKGVTEQKPVPVMLGAMAKVFLLAVLLVFASQFGLELFSTLAGITTFFFSLFFTLAGRHAAAWYVNRPIATTPTTTGGRK